MFVEIANKAVIFDVSVVLIALCCVVGPRLVGSPAGKAGGIGSEGGIGVEVGLYIDV